MSGPGAVGDPGHALCLVPGGWVARAAHSPTAAISPGVNGPCSASYWLTASSPDDEFLPRGLGDPGAVGQPGGRGGGGDLGGEVRRQGARWPPGRHSRDRGPRLAVAQPLTPVTSDGVRWWSGDRLRG